MIKKRVAALVVMTGAVCGVCAQDALKVTQLDVVDANGVYMVQMNDQGNISAKGLFLTPNKEGYYSNTLGLSFNQEKVWSLVPYVSSRGMGATDTLSFHIFADTLKTSNDMIVGGIFNCESRVYVKDRSIFYDDVEVVGRMEARTINAGNGKFTVGSDGKVTLHDVLNIAETVGGGPARQFKVSVDSDSWTVSTVYGVPNASTNYLSSTPLIFKATNYTFQDGDMTVEGTITCKNKMKVVEVETGKLKADDVTVNMNNAADYVFDENYDLKSLGEVEAYVKANKHLPGIPSASQMKEEGMNVSEMSNLLLEKIEELTLHLIRVEKENQALKAEVEALKK